MQDENDKLQASIESQYRGWGKQKSGEPTPPPPEPKPGDVPNVETEAKPNTESSKESSPDQGVITFERGGGLHGGGSQYQFGPFCCVRFLSDDDETVTVPLAEDVWPRYVYEHVDDDETGVYLEYRHPNGQKRHCKISAAAFNDKSNARRYTADLQKVGVQIKPNKGAKFAEALGWFAQLADPDVVYLTRRPGWHRNNRIYVNGTDIIGDAEEWYANDQQMAIRRRDHKNGELAEYRKFLNQHIDTPGLRASVGISLAGAVVDYIGHNPFIVHICGRSSIGKSTAGKLAASIWSKPYESSDSLLKTWDSTSKALEAICVSANSACVVFDEIAKNSQRPEYFADTVHRIASRQGRTRLNADSTERKQREWNLTAISTGETSMRNKIGDYLQGGQMVRMLDLGVEHGELTRDAEHTDTIDGFIQGIGSSSGTYGVASRPFVEQIFQTDVDQILKIKKSFEIGLDEHTGDGTTETGRILSNIAVVGSALVLGRRAGVHDWTRDEIDETVYWMAERIVSDRAQTKTPNERALEAWHRLIASTPSAFPKSSSDANGEIYGYRKSAMTDDGIEIWTSLAMLRQTNLKQSVSPSDFVEWAKSEGLCREPGRVRMNGVQRRWKVFDLDKMAEYLS